MTVSPTISFWLGVGISIAIAISAGTLQLTNAIPDAWIPLVTGWSRVFAFSGSVVLTALHGISSDKAGPLTK